MLLKSFYNAARNHMHVSCSRVMSLACFNKWQLDSFPVLRHNLMPRVQGKVMIKRRSQPVNLTRAVYVSLFHFQSFQLYLWKVIITFFCKRFSRGKKNLTVSSRPKGLEVRSPFVSECACVWSLVFMYRHYVYVFCDLLPYVHYYDKPNYCTFHDYTSRL